ncbi:DUF4422 domain-containing protein [Bifidobacterium apri]|uniref:DUF4422 domain-containing protein n=1 Tax=Bifidobacterium apri TaxID=1769423 RepID=UPI003996AB27
MSIEILVATSKRINFELPSIYKPVQINCKNAREIIPEYYHDNTGENISIKNPYYCELTALYWGWKNSKADIIGLCHYRRYFSKFENPWFDSFFRTTDRHLVDDSITAQQIDQYLKKYDVIVGMPHLPFPDTAYEDLKKSCYEKDIKALIYVMKEYYTNDYETLIHVLNKQNLFYFNMLICKKETMDDYCRWLFGILEKVEKICDLTGYNRQRKRLYGYLAEVLLNVYVTERHLRTKNVELLLINSQLERKGKIASSNIKVNIMRILSRRPLRKIAKIYYKYKKKTTYDSYLRCIATMNSPQQES